MTPPRAPPHPRARYIVSLSGERHDVEILPNHVVLIDGDPVQASLVPTTPPRSPGAPPHAGAAPYSLLLDGASHALLARGGRGGAWELELDGRAVAAEVLDPRAHRVRRLSEKAAAGAKTAPLTAPMPGLVVRVAVEEGSVVQAGDAIMIVEAMKMENELRAPAPARVKRLLAAPGDAVSRGQLLAEFEESEAT